jgi:hypothetical protein
MVDEPRWILRAATVVCFAIVSQHESGGWVRGAESKPYSFNRPVLCKCNVVTMIPKDRQMLRTTQ